ncbi:unnamed protein product, partial [Heterosigma akashiwo]
RGGAARADAGHGAPGAGLLRRVRHFSPEGRPALLGLRGLRGRARPPLLLRRDLRRAEELPALRPSFLL